MATKTGMMIVPSRNNSLSGFTPYKIYEVISGTGEANLSEVALKLGRSTKDYVPVGFIVEGEAISPLEFKVTKSAENVSPAFRKGAVVPMNGAFWTWQRDHEAEFVDICEQGLLQ